MTDVIIAGAGPTGLWLAGELRLAGVEVLLVDKSLERDSNSRALTIHPRTVEMLACRGLQEPFLAEGLVYWSILKMIIFQGNALI